MNLCYNMTDPLKLLLGLKYERESIFTNKRNVGFFVGVCFIVNAITGTGIAFISTIFQNSGFIFTTSIFLLYSYVAIQSSLFVVETMRRVPGNDDFGLAIEFTTLVDFFFGRKSYIFSLALFILTLMSNTVEAIVITSQVIDTFYVTVFGGTCAIKTHPPSFACVQAIREKDPSPFGEEKVIVTFGFLSVILTVIPFGLFSLEENMTAQILFFFAAVVTMLIWFGISFNEGFDFSKVPLIGSSYLYAPGTVMLNLALASIVPSWVNLKKSTVNIKLSLIVSTVVSLIMYYIGGYFPATALDIGNSENINPSLMNVSSLGKISVFIFPIATLIPSIPISMMVCAGNLKRSGILNKVIVIFIAFVLPWLVSIPLQTGNGMITFVSWTSIVFSSTVNYVIGPILYLKSKKFKNNFENINDLSSNQKRLLMLQCDPKISDSYGIIDSEFIDTSVIPSDTCNDNDFVCKTKVSEKISIYPQSQSSSKFDNTVPPNFISTQKHINSRLFDDVSPSDNIVPYTDIDSTLQFNDLIGGNCLPNYYPNSRKKFLSGKFWLTSEGLAYINISVVIFSILLNFAVEIRNALR